MPVEVPAATVHIENWADDYSDDDVPIQSSKLNSNARYGTTCKPAREVSNHSEACVGFLADWCARYVVMLM